MSIVAACGGWVAAAVLTATWLAVQRALDSRMEAVARACHELRGPIGAARLGLELGSRGGALSAEQLLAIDAELGRATLALEDLEGAPDRRAAPRERTAVDLHDLLAQTVRAWQPAASAAGSVLELEWEGGADPVLGDRLRLAQATSNLIANAIEHGGGRVTVRARTHDRAARIEVFDCGGGLPAPLGELTRRARRGRGRRGRGLAITAAVAAAHKGRLTSGRSEHGARLILELPAAPTAGA